MREILSGKSAPSALTLLLLLTFAWGFNWPLLKIVLSEMAPLHFRTWCLMGGAAGLFAIAAAYRQPLRVPRGQWLRLILITLFNVTAWNVLVAYGVSLMDSGRASILGFTMPVWGVLLGRWLFGEALTPRRLLGLALGIAAMVFLLGGELGAAGRSPLGAALMLAAAALWAVGTVMIKRWSQLGMPATVFTAWTLLLGGVPVLFAVPFEEGSFSLLRLSPGPLLAFGYTLFIAFIFCYWAWTRVVTTLPVVVSSLSTLIVPVVGVFSGMLVLGERPQWTDFTALILVTASVATVLPYGRRSSRGKDDREAAG